MDALQPDDPVNVGAYRLIGKVGAGGMGRVYLGVSPGGRKVAVKLVHADQARDREFRERFATEVEAARRVGGFHTAQVVDADPLADPPWMVTAFIEGPSLQVAVSDGGPLGPDEVRELGAGLAEGLAAIHACGLVHRDVKPSNVILGRDGPRIIDFGIARLAGTAKVTASGTVLGTLAYMSPEQVKGEPVGAASDLFSLACTLVFAATGHSPFEGQSTAAVLYRIAHAAPGLTGLPGDATFRELIARCLAKDPSDRPPLAEVLAALSASGERGSVSPRPSGAGTPAAAADQAGVPSGTADAAVPGALWNTVTVPAPAASRGAPTVTAGTPGNRAAAATRVLPRDIASFTGREQQLRALMDAPPPAGGVVGITAIGGMAGIGKTAFAVHAAHRLADRFPAGQIFLPLHGHTPGRPPVDPADALASLLLSLGVPAGQIPADLEARTSLWWDRLAERKLLLVLDDAASSEQVIPLLPGAGGSLVLVTSRRHLSALEDATAISLDTLPPGEAAALLVRLAGRPGLSPADPAVGEITRLCGYLPLAIGMVARQLHHHPAWTAAARAAELASARDRLELLATENVSVAAAFDLSYADITDDQQRLFRRLGLHLGTDIDGYAAAALDGTGLPAARRGLEALYDQYLLTEPAQGRYRMHDLIREHARALADRLDQEQDRAGATERLLDYYSRAAARADALIARRTRPAPPATDGADGAPSADGAGPPAVPALAGTVEALAWARAERASLLACLDYAAGTGQHARVIAFTEGLAGLLRSDGPWAEAVTRHTAAVQAARQLGDRLGQANALTDLGEARWLTDDHQAAAQALEQALSIYRDLGNRLGQANVLNELGVVRWLTAEYPAAVDALERALGICRDLDDRLGQANALRGLGGVRWMKGEYTAAAEAMEQALSIHRDLGNRIGQANALRDLGVVRWLMGEHTAAVAALEQALGIYRDLGDRIGQANALRYLGDVRRSAGDYPAAAEALEQALSIHRDLGNRSGQAGALISLGGVRRQRGEYPAADEALEQALGIYRELGNQLGHAGALAYLGVLRRLRGEYPAAAQYLDQALGMYLDLGARGDEAEVRNEKGTLHRVSGDLAQAERCHRQALDLARAIASPWHEAHALAGLGRCALASGDAAQAEDLLRQALEIFQRTGAAEVSDLLAELDALTGSPPQAVTGRAVGERGA